MAFSTTPKRALSAAVLSSVVVLGLAACGSDTVDNSADNSAAVPSVTVSKSASEKPSETAADKSSSAAATAKPSASAQSGSTGGEVVKNAQDGGVEQVSEVPSGDGRTDEDNSYLEDLKSKGIDLEKGGKTVAEASSQSGTTISAADAQQGLEDSLIATGREYCRASQAGQQDLLTPVAAGQLQTKGVYTGDPSEAQKIIVDAAKSAYCS